MQGSGQHGASVTRLCKRVKIDLFLRNFIGTFSAATCRRIVAIVGQYARNCYLLCSIVNGSELNMTVGVTLYTSRDQQDTDALICTEPLPSVIRFIYRFMKISLRVI